MITKPRPPSSPEAKSDSETPRNVGTSGRFIIAGLTRWQV